MTNQTGRYHHGDLRAALLAEAAAMIAEEGVVSVTMRAIGRRLGVSRAAPYRHFADKNALLVAVAADGFNRLKAACKPLTGAARDPASSGSGAWVRSTCASPSRIRRTTA